MATASSITLASGSTYTTTNNATITGTGSDTIIAGNNDTITLTGGNDVILTKDYATITINGGGNQVTVNNDSSVTINDARSFADGYSGSILFSDMITAKDYNTVSLNYTASLGASDNVSINFNPLLILGTGDTVNAAYTVNAGKGDTIAFTGSGESILLNAGSGDTILTSGVNDTITIGGAAATKSSMTIGATAAGTTIDGGLGTDTFTAGAGYTGGVSYAGSAHGYQDGFNAIGSCANYSGLACRVTVNFATDIGQGFDRGGNLLWTDTYKNVQQVKAASADGNILTGSDAYYCELKGGLGGATYNGGAAGDRVIWSSAGATGLNDGHSTDVAYAGAGNDEFYWRNSPGGKGLSNLGEAIYGFNIGQGDDLNLSEFATAGFAGVNRAFGGANDLANWVNVSSNGNDTNVWFDKTGSGNFTQLAAVLKNDNLFADFGVTNQSSAGAQLVVQDLYNTGHLVLTQPH